MDHFFSKNTQIKSIYEKNLEDKSNLINEFKKSEIAQKIKEAFPDSELKDVKRENK